MMPASSQIATNLTNSYWNNLDFHDGCKHKLDFIPIDHSALNSYKSWPQATGKAIVQTKNSETLTGELLLVKIIV